ncbi:MAG: biopolymer transporter ExbD [Alphaproteobacteria bacterium]|nr:biopolymer transporter ExbD [Alphaproteobacteria bacterium]
MRLSRPKARRDEERILPLINIVFLLLIFFMIAGRLSAGDPFQVTPPNSMSEAMPQSRDVMILMGAEGQFALDGAVMPKDAVLERLERQIADGTDLALHLKTDGAASAQLVVDFMAELRKAGFQELTLLTVPGG